MIRISVRLSYRSKVTQNKINCVKNCPSGVWTHNLWIISLMPCFAWKIPISNFDCFFIWSPLWTDFSPVWVIVVWMDCNVPWKSVVDLDTELYIWLSDLNVLKGIFKFYSLWNFMCLIHKYYMNSKIVSIYIIAT